MTFSYGRGGGYDRTNQRVFHVKKVSNVGIELQTQKAKGRSDVVDIVRRSIP